MTDAILKSILFLSNTAPQVMRTEQTGVQSRKERNPAKIVSSIRSVSDTFLRHYANSPKETDVPTEYFESLCALSKITLKYFPVPLNSSAGYSILQMLQWDRDEVMHSKIISSLLNPFIMGKSFATDFFLSLINWKVFEKLEFAPSYQNVYCERTLKKVFPGIHKDKARRRIDILVESSKHILVIENKVDSYELEDQTQDYYDAIKSGYSLPENTHYFLILSPLGFEAKCPDFNSISYMDLYDLLISISPPLSSGAKALLDFYLIELKNSLLKHRVSSKEIALDHLRRNGYVSN